MIACTKITSTASPHFSDVDRLYAQAFPWHEQREMAAKCQALDDPHYALEAWFDSKTFIGLSGSWTFGDYVYIEHLAIESAFRSQGYGKAILKEIVCRASTVILEIDPLTTEIAHKRLRFYESMGFHANPWRHTHPAYHQDIADHELIVMSYPQPLEEDRYQRFNDDLRHRVMAVK